MGNLYSPDDPRWPGCDHDWRRDQTPEGIKILVCNLCGCEINDEGGDD